MRLISPKARPILIAGALALAACDEQLITVGNNTTGTGVGGAGSGAGGGTGSGGDGGGAIEQVDTIDILLDIDNSRSMADKQQILAIAVADLTNALINPPCLDESGLPAAPQPAGPLDVCPPGSSREHQPVLDMHIGVISSSIGSAGGSACIATPDKPTVDDRAHLLSRLGSEGGGSVPTYQNQGFLAWDPAAQNDPPGEADAGLLAGRLADMVLGVGQVGCGYEAQLESWYRFLIDPEPYQSISIVNGAATPSGVDEELLAQRRSFLRPHSLLVILQLTDENDCSIKEYGQFYFAAQLSNGNGPYHLPRARSECTQNPNDPCCKSCGQDPGDCPTDPGCAAPLDDIEDHANLRCFDQKRRFGINFLYPSDRYVQALTSTTITNRDGQIVPNPIFSDLDPLDNFSWIRNPSLVVLAGIVGVPWQDLARDPTDLGQGYKNAVELAAPVINGATTWDVILGDPSNYIPPLDPHMIEGYLPRTGTNPLTGDAIAPPGSPNGTNPINGHEYTIGGGGDPYSDLQYACIFDLPMPRDCAGATGDCDCDAAAAPDSPLCEGSIQERAKAYPGIRELEVLKGVGAQAVVASICPSQTANPSVSDYAYRPAATALLERMKKSLK
jgi:hypothetical protein